MDQSIPKCVFLAQIRNNKNCHYAQHFWISLGKNFQINQTFCFFGPNLPKKGIQHIQHSVFSIFNIIEITNFILNIQFWCFRPNFCKKDNSDSKHDKWTSPLTSKPLLILRFDWFSIPVSLRAIRHPLYPLLGVGKKF